MPVGEFGRAHGLKGEVRLKSFTADPASIASYGELHGGDGRLYRLQSVRAVPGPSPDLLVARVDGISTREGAEALNRVLLRIPRDRLPPPEDEDEFLAADLLGLAVEDTAGAPIGRVLAVVNYGGGDLLELAIGRGTVLLPFTKAVVPVIDLQRGRIVAEPPLGLLDDDDDPGARAS